MTKRNITPRSHFLRANLNIFYEFRPFLCVLVALLSTKYIDVDWVKGPAIILFIIGFCILALRITSRHLSKSKANKYTTI